VEPVEVIAGSATKVRILVGYGHNPDALPDSMVLKSGFDPIMRSLAAQLYRNEAAFFRSAAPALDIPLVRCFYAGSDDTGQSALVLEDLGAAGATFGQMTEPLAPAIVAEALAQLASLHARFWGEVDAPEVAPLTAGAEGQQMVLQVLLGADNWQRCVDLGRFDGLPERVLDREAVAGAVFPLLDQDPERPAALVHGDAHLGNLWFDQSGRPRWLDWQAAGAGKWEADTAYFLVGALTPEDRRVHERDLLFGYLEALGEAGVADPPDSESAWAAYRRQLPYGMLGLLCTPEMQSEEFCRAMGERFAAAIDDHAVL
jgi:aminoglycoside/choline kinase family phosphotransferase